MTTVRTRFAPSPTGFLHVGGLRTAAYAYALAKHNDGKFILRIEDTDQKRFVPGSVEKIYSILQQFGLNWDEGPFIQSERVATGIYKQAAEKLLADGHAFYCQCEAKNAKEKGFSKELRDPCRDKNLTTGAIKLKVPDNQTVSFTDFVLGKKVSWNTSAVSDTTLLKTDGFPTYHLAVVVDDHDMEITHVIRAAEWMPSTPIHLLVYQYLGYSLPEIGHPTAILDPNGGKLSKRKGNVSCEAFIADGFLPEALLNWVFLLGWAPKDNRELFTLPELVKVFDPKGFQKSNPALNLDKLKWFNGQYIRQKSDEDLLPLIRPYAPDSASDDLLMQIIPLAKQRLTNLKDFATLTKFFFEAPSHRHSGLDPESAFLPAIHQALKDCVWDKASIETTLSDLANSHSWDRSDFFMTLRLAICGQKVTPPLTESMLILGKDESLSRIANSYQLTTND